MPLIFNLRKLAIMMVVVCGFLGLLASTAKADSFTYVINIPNSGLSGSPAPYANVTLTLVGGFQGATNCSQGCINVNVQMLSNYEMFGNGNGNGAFGFNIVGSTAGLTVTNLASDAGTGAGEGPGLSGLVFDSNGGNFDGFGGFELALEGPPASGALDFATFTVSRTGGFSTANALFEGNSQGRHFAVHVAPTNGNPTGFATDGGTSILETPEPASMLLLGTGLVGVATGLRRRRNARK